jgi:FtsP/CotA-like multicopper oxidase with cupredoxin domain
VSRTQRFGLLAVAVALAVGGFVIAKPADEEEPARRPPAATQKRPPEPRSATVEIRSGTVVGGVRTLEVTKGEEVRIVVRSDAPDEIHLHGYDITRKVAPGKPARFAFRADIEGLFELEAHDLGHERVASLAVEPG